MALLEKLLGSRELQTPGQIVDQLIAEAQSKQEQDVDSARAFYCRDVIRPLADGTLPDPRRFQHCCELLHLSPDDVRQDVATYRHFQVCLAEVGDDWHERYAQAEREVDLTLARFQAAEQELADARKAKIDAAYRRRAIHDAKLHLSRLRREHAFLPQEGE